MAVREQNGSREQTGPTGNESVLILHLLDFYFLLWGDKGNGHSRAFYLSNLLLMELPEQVYEIGEERYGGHHKQTRQDGLRAPREVEQY